MKRYLFLWLVLSVSLIGMAQKQKIAGSMVEKLRFSGDKVIINDTVEKSMNNLIIQMSLLLDENNLDNIIDERYRAICLSYTPNIKWNTLSLPFTPTHEFLKQIFGHNYQLFYYSGYEDGKILLEKLSSDDAIRYGQPLIVYASEDAMLGKSPFYLTDVNINKEAQIVVDNTSGINFWGAFSTSNISAHNDCVFNLTNDGTVIMLEGDVNYKAFHGYFDMTSVLGDAERFSVYYKGENETVKVITHSIKNDSIPQMLYDLQGRCIKNPGKGIFILNGKKVVLH
ncbi:MAG: hypothetical protein IJ190_03130 [Prevotella sp.]|nr:hypothetical protein [Prevotella sp.]